LRIGLAIALLAAWANGQDRPTLIVQTEPEKYPIAWSADSRLILMEAGVGTIVLWDVNRGEELRRIRSEYGQSVFAFAPDGKTFASGGYAEGLNARVHIWETATGRLLHTVPLPSLPSSLQFSRDGRRLLVSTMTWREPQTAAGAIIAIIDTRRGRIRRQFLAVDERGKPNMWGAFFSRNEKQVICFGSDKTLRIFTTKGKRVRSFPWPDLDWWSADGITLAPDGKHVLVPTARGAVLRDLDKWEIVRRYEHPDIKPPAFINHSTPYYFSQDRKEVFAGAAVFDAITGKLLRRVPPGHLSPDCTLVSDGDDVRSTKTGEVVCELRGQTTLPTWVDVTRDGWRLLSCRSDGTGTTVWDLVYGEPESRLEPGLKAAFSPKGDRVAALSSDRKLFLYGIDSDKRRVIRGIRPSGMRGSPIGFTPDGLRVFMVEGNPVLRDASTGKLARVFKSVSPANVVGLAPDGAWIVAGCKDGSVRFWETATGKELRWFQGDPTWLGSLAVHPSGDRVFVGGINGTNYLANLEGVVVRKLPEFRTTAATFSHSGQLFATSLGPGHVRLWSTKSGKQIRQLGPGGYGNVVFSADDRHLFSTCRDGTVRVWAVRTGKELCSLVELRDGSWAVIDPRGRYDASNGGDIEGVYWQFKGNAYRLGQLKEHFYDPGLLSKLLGHTKEPLLKVPVTFAPKSPPKLTVKMTPDGVEIELEERGGGVGRVVVKLNGKEISADAQPGEKLKFEFPLRGDRRQLPGMENTIEVFAYNGDGTLRGRGVSATYSAAGKIDKPVRLWGVVVGTSDYDGDKIDLRYAAKDAADFATALRVAANSLLGEKRVSVRLVSNGTRTALVDALKAARDASSHDILVLYLAGHGVSATGDGGEYFYLTREAKSVAGISDPEVRARTAISTRQLADLLNEIPATRQVMVLDTCAAGGFVDKLAQIRRVPSSQLRALHRLKDRTGFHILAGCAADKVSYEASRFAQGLLTHSLLLGMRGAALRENKFVDVLKLFGFSVRRVPKLAGSLGGVQRPVLAIPRGLATFDIGKLEGAAKAKVPLKSPLPLVLRSNFQDEQAFADVLGLAPLVNAGLRDAAVLVFVDAMELPGACRVVGRYRVEGTTVKVAVRVFRDNKLLAEFKIAGDNKDAAALAGKLVAAVQEKVG